MPIQRHRIIISSHGREVFRAEYEFDGSNLTARNGALNDALDRSGYGERIGPDWDVKAKVEKLDE